jgi:hypothetical protein
MIFSSSILKLNALAMWAPNTALNEELVLSRLIAFAFSHSLGHNRTHAPQQSEPYSITISASARSVGGFVRLSAVFWGRLVHGFQRFTKNVFRPLGWGKLEISFWRCGPRAVRPAAHG